MTKTEPMTTQPSGLLMRAMAAGVLVVAAATAFQPAHAEGFGRNQGHGVADPGADAMVFGGQPRYLARMLDHMLDGLNATDAQRTQIRQIATAAAADIKTQRDSARSLREKGLQIFTAPTVDAAAAEAVRQQMSVQLDTTSKRYLKAMLDVSNVLTPAQRATLGERMKQRQAQMRDRDQREQREHPGQSGRETPGAKP